MSNSRENVLQSVGNEQSFITAPLFEGTVRAFDEGVAEFSVQISPVSRLFGEWRPTFDHDGETFSVAIVSFGYAEKTNVSNTTPEARAKFRLKDTEIIIGQINILFSDQKARSKYMPFASKKAKFTGQIHFLADWVRLY